MNQGEYDLIPHREILELKEQIEELKKQKGLAEKGAEAEIEITNKELYDSMNRLTDGINQMIKLFKKAGDEFSKYDEQDAYIKKLVPMEKKVDELTEQNKKIARGILAVADSIKDQLSTLSDSFDDKISEIKESLNPSMPAMHQNMPMGNSGGFDPMPQPSMSPMGAEGVPPPPIPPPIPPR